MLVASPILTTLLMVSIVANIATIALVAIALFIPKPDVMALYIARRIARGPKTMLGAVIMLLFATPFLVVFFMRNYKRWVDDFLDKPL